MFCSLHACESGKALTDASHEAVSCVHDMQLDLLKLPQRPFALLRANDPEDMASRCAIAAQLRRAAAGEHYRTCTLRQAGLMHALMWMLHFVWIGQGHRRWTHLMQHPVPAEGSSWGDEAAVSPALAAQAWRSQPLPASRHAGTTFGSPTTAWAACRASSQRQPHNSSLQQRPGLQSHALSVQLQHLQAQQSLSQSGAQHQRSTQHQHHLQQQHTAMLPCRLPRAQLQLPEASHDTSLISLS